MVDIFGREIHEGDKILRASTQKDRGIAWTMHRVVGFAPQMIKIDETNIWTHKEYSVISPNNVLVISETDRFWWKKENKDAS